MFDTHTHLNFSRYKGRVDEVISHAKEVGVEYMAVPGTDTTTSQKAVEIAETNENIYASVGIHPHHVYEFQNANLKTQIDDEIKKIEQLLSNPKVMAVGELGMDRHKYDVTKYENYAVNENFIELQKVLVEKQIKLAIRHNKSVILHNREAKEDLLPLLEKLWDSKLNGRAVFHCCEPDPEILSFAKEREMFIGVDGDITYTPEKQEFIKTLPLEMLVLETDSPFLLPEPLRTEKKFPNEPKNMKLISEFIAGILGMDVERLREVTTANAKQLFHLQ